ncbi:hypothetical protein EC9_11970 [Rosistilla ulvae]|uniref:Uncharacterized protein n=1 Tax=Rosistilla ulvae TaxID=1930277 RepID=A0A517LWL3_9BACT|nr:hypothetical protein [Rosistilla ulvae]QDS87021.1 hypothetical protein EC9_11970 [Rosistilla ulvae]
MRNAPSRRDCGDQPPDQLAVHYLENGEIRSRQKRRSHEPWHGRSQAGAEPRLYDDTIKDRSVVR